MSDKTEYVTDDDVERENLKMGFEQIKSEYKLKFEMLKIADEKLNMVLVFNGAVLALLFAVIPFDFESKLRFILSIVLFTIFIISIAATIITIFLGLYPKKIPQIGAENYVNSSTYRCSLEEFVGKFMSGFQTAIQAMEKIAERKHALNKHAMIFTIINIVLIIALIIIKII